LTVLWQKIKHDVSCQVTKEYVVMRESE